VKDLVQGSYKTYPESTNLSIDTVLKFGKKQSCPQVQYEPLSQTVVQTVQLKRKQQDDIKPDFEVVPALKSTHPDSRSRSVLDTYQ